MAAWITVPKPICLTETLNACGGCFSGTHKPAHSGIHCCSVLDNTISLATFVFDPWFIHRSVMSFSRCRTVPSSAQITHTPVHFSLFCALLRLFLPQHFTSLFFSIYTCWSVSKYQDFPFGFLSLPLSSEFLTSDQVLLFLKGELVLPTVCSLTKTSFSCETRPLQELLSSSFWIIQTSGAWQVHLHVFLASEPHVGSTLHGFFLHLP